MQLDACLDGDRALHSDGERRAGRNRRAPGPSARRRGCVGTYVCAIIDTHRLKYDLLLTTTYSSALAWTTATASLLSRMLSASWYTGSLTGDRPRGRRLRTLCQRECWASACDMSACARGTVSPERRHAGRRVIASSKGNGARVDRTGIARAAMASHGARGAISGTGNYKLSRAADGDWLCVGDRLRECAQPGRVLSAKMGVRSGLLGQRKKSS